MNDDAEKPGAGLNISVWFAVAGLVIILDRLTKILSDTHLVEGQPVGIFPGFDLLLAYNTGAAFSFLHDAGGWQRWLLTGVSISVSAFLTVWLIKLPRSQKLLGLSIALILGGALGNLYDRLLAGYVVDFISLYFMDWRFATFNLADSAISVGAALMILDMIIDYRHPVSGKESG